MILRPVLAKIHRLPSHGDTAGERAETGRSIRGLQRGLNCVGKAHTGAQT